MKKNMHLKKRKNYNFREPLARTINRNYNLPKEAKDPNFEYGVRIIKNNVTTTEYLNLNFRVLFPSDLPFKESEEDA